MGKAIPVALGGVRFPTKKKALEHIRSILYSYKIGQTVTDPEHTAVLNDLLARHPEREDKVGSGVVAFFVGDGGEYGGQCFWVRRTDGTTEDFSFVRCLESFT